MGRIVSKFALGPPGVCDACGRFCQGLHQAGKRCYHCKAGTFIHRGEWHFSPCPSCGGADGGCSQCQDGIVARRKVAIDPDAIVWHVTSPQSTHPEASQHGELDGFHVAAVWLNSGRWNVTWRLKLLSDKCASEGEAKELARMAAERERAAEAAIAARSPD